MMRSAKPVAHGLIVALLKFKLGENDPESTPIAEIDLFVGLRSANVRSSGIQLRIGSRRNVCGFRTL